MRAAVAASFVVLAVAVSARADVSVDERRAAAPAARTPRTPLGPACDAALAAAQEKFRDGLRPVDFHVRERRVVGEYSWSDMCGVWGNYSVELAPDARPPAPWSWIERRPGDDASFHRRGTRRAHGWRARFVIDGDSDGHPGDWFVDCFRPAVDVCLATASARR